MVFHLQLEGTEPLVFGRTKLTNHVALQWQELVRIQLVVFRELLRTLFEDNFVGGVTPCRAGSTGGLVRVKVDDVLCDGDIGTGMTAGRTVAFLNKLTDLVIFEVQQTPPLINDVQLLEVTRRAVHPVLYVDNQGEHHRNQQ